MDLIKKLEELREQRGEVLSRMEAWAGTAATRTLTDEEREGYRKDKGEIDALDERIKIVQAQIEEQRREVGGQEGGRPAEVHDPPKFTRLGEMLQAVHRASVPGGEVDPRLENVHAEARAQGASSAIPQDGGFLVQSEFNTALLQRAQEEALVWTRTQRFPVSNGDTLDLPYIDETSRADGSRFGGVQVFRNHEAESVTAKKPQFGQHRLELEDLTGLAYATDNQLQDAPLLAAIFQNAFASEFNFKLDDEVIAGTGAGEMLGILNADSVVIVAKETNQAATTFNTQNVIKMWSRLWNMSRRNAIWLINQDVVPQLMQMTLAAGTGGVPVYMPANGLSGEPFGTLMGRPVIEIEQASTLGTKGDVILADLSQYGIAEKGGLEAAMSMHVRFINHEQTFRWKMRNNGQPLWASALTPKNGSKTVSPFVVLANRS